MINGLEKITDEILTQARDQAKEVERQSQERIQEIKARAVEEAEAWEAKAEEKLLRELEEIRSRERSKRELEKNRAVLEAKQKIIQGMLEKAKEKVNQADTETYFAWMKKLFARCVHGAEGQMYLGSRDYRRMPKGFEGEIQKIAADSEGRIEIREDAAVPDGFRLVYGGVEENCTLEALFEERKNELWDVVNEILWRESDGR